MANNPNQNQMGQGGQKPGNLDRNRRGDQQSGEQGGFQHEPKPGADQQNKNPNRQGGETRDQGGQAPPRQGSRDENR